MAPAQTLSRERLWAISLVPGWLASALVVGVALVGQSLPPLAQYVPLGVSVLVLGLPHGAVDHLAVARARGQHPDRLALARVVAIYGVAGGAYTIGWFLTPAIAFALFIGLTWFHWGQGDLYALIELAGADHLHGRGHRLATVFVRGGLPMLVPLFSFPMWYQRVATDVVGLFAPDAVATLTWVFRPDVRLALGAGYGLVLVATLAVGYVHADDPFLWRVDAAETLGLAVFFAVVPPVLAVGVYFCLWHSLRHVVRLLLVDDRAVAALEAGAVGRAFAQFARDALPLTVVSLALLAGLAVLVPNPPATVPQWVGLYLVFLAVVTLPHVVVVVLMDEAQRIWA